MNPGRASGTSTWPGPWNAPRRGDCAPPSRTLVTEVHATRTTLAGGGSGPVAEEDLTAWVAGRDAADALRSFLRLPLTVAAEAVLQRRVTLHWRDELAVDLRGT
ncbi:hypothetical protein [Streptomyces sp. NPDC008137]|uniref:hypothetical protein n=1 Tax=Streptomyces sp. NPDC008137 TaxID=3364813 RepID=UPI0036E40227